MVRLPRTAIDEAAFAAALAGCDEATLRTAGGHLVLDIHRQSDDADEDWSRDDEDWLPALAPLREAALDGDARLAYLAWLTAVSAGGMDERAVEPLAGLGPLDPAMEAFAALFGIDVDLLAAAAERVSRAPAPARDPAAGVARLSTEEKDAWLVRLHAGEGGLGAALRARLRPPAASGPAASDEPRRTVGALLARAEELTVERRAAEARAAEEARRRARAEEERKRRARVVALASRGEWAWREVETEIERRHASGYDRAATLLADLRALAERDGAVPAYDRRVAEIRARHAAKRTFIQRLDRTGARPPAKR